MTAQTKTYPPIDNLRGDCGESSADLSVVAVLDPSPHYPDCARIIVGSTRQSESAAGAWCSGPEAAVRLAGTLLDAARDVDAATDAEQPPIVDVIAADLARCESCCQRIASGDRAQFYDERSTLTERDVVVHAGSCPPATDGWMVEWAVEWRSITKRAGPFERRADAVAYRDAVTRHDGVTSCRTFYRRAKVCPPE